VRLLGRVAGVTAAACALAAVAAASASKEDVEEGKRVLAAKSLEFPVKGYQSALRDNFDELRGKTPHEALDIMAPRGTPVVATDDGVVKKLFTSKPGGLTVYQFDPDQRFCYYYAHLDAYAPGLHEGQQLRRGEVLGYVGTTGNARHDAPHLHFTVYVLPPGKQWWKGVAINAFEKLAVKAAN
jgi:murein DD-endopeptidase MepM/ murein hydrolase activator NlpD